MKYLVHSNFGTAGGHQSAHQICATLTEVGEDAYMIYPPIGHDRVVPLWSNIYGVEKFVHREFTNDEPDQVHIIPAMWGPNWYPCDAETYSCIKVTGDDPYKSKKVLYWLGVVKWQDWEYYGEDRDINLDHPNIKKMYHACQSQFAYDFLTNSGKVDPKTVFMLRDYTHEMYLSSDYELYIQRHKRNNIVLYNGAKGLQHTYRLMDECANINCMFVKLENLNREQIRDIAKTAKVYIDFGHHPGKDRIPREMAACGCIVITGHDGTAACDTDVPVGKRKFKRINGGYDYTAIRNQIENDMYDYMSGFLDEDQVKYRMSIRKERLDVLEDVRNMVKTINENNL